LPPESSVYNHDVQKSEQGQALVEAAFILPAMIFLLLLTIQLTQLQQARIMVEYAAFSAARTGIVHNGDNGNSNGFDGPMHDAAVLAVLPTFGRTDSFTHIGATWLRFKAEEAVLRPFGLSQVRVYVLSPTKADFTSFGMILYRDGNDGQAFHRDTDMRWLDDTVIAILTLGAQRPWLLRPRTSRYDHSPGRGAVHDLAPAAGDLIVMGGRAQRDWRHCVPKETTPCGPRISINFAPERHSVLRSVRRFD